MPNERKRGFREPTSEDVLFAQHLDQLALASQQMAMGSSERQSGMDEILRLMDQKLERVVFRLIRIYPEAAEMKEDLMQTAREAVISKALRLFKTAREEGDVAPFVGYALMVARHSCIQLIQKRLRAMRREQIVVDKADQDPSAEYAWSQVALAAPTDQSAEDQLLLADEVSELLKEADRILNTREKVVFHAMREALAANIDTNQSINEFIANKLDMKVSDVRPILSRIRSKLSKKSFTHERPTLQEYDVLKKGLLQALMERFQASQLAKQFDRQVVLQQCKDVIAIVDHTAVRGSYVAAERAAVTAVAELCRRFNCRDQYLEMLDKVLVYITKKYPDTDNA